MIPTGQDSLNTRSTLEVGGKAYAYYSLAKAAATLGDVVALPFSMKVLLENLLRFEDGVTVTRDDIQAMVDWQKERSINREIQYRPARVLMQDFTGVPAVVDLAAMRDAMTQLGGDPQKINPLVPVHLVIDHSVMVDEFGTPKAFERECRARISAQRRALRVPQMGRDGVRQFQGRAAGHRHLPPGQSRIYRADGVDRATDQNGEMVAYPDTLVGTDSHTTMVNGLGVLGWGVGGIEAEAAMLGQPVSMLIPEVVGFRLTGALKEGITATDLVLTVTQMLRAKGVVGRFVEFFGPGARRAEPRRPRDDRQHGARIWRDLRLLPDRRARRIDYLRLTGRDDDRIALVRGLCQGAGHVARAVVARSRCSPTRSSSTCRRSSRALAGPKRPQDRVRLSRGRRGVQRRARSDLQEGRRAARRGRRRPSYDIGHGDVVIAAITSCTNTSNPSVLVAAGLVARKARALGPRPQALGQDQPRAGQPGGDRLSRRGRPQRGSRTRSASTWSAMAAPPASAIRGRSPEPISEAINENDLVAASVLSGNRNFEGRVSPDCAPTTSPRRRWSSPMR